MTASPRPRILHLSSSDRSGGASMLARELVEGLRRRGFAVDMLVGKQSGASGEGIRVIEPKGRHAPRRWLWRPLDYLAWHPLHLQHRFPRSMGRAYWESYDLIHLHDLPSCFNFGHLPWLSRRRPVVWTIHSMAPFTGNCIFAFDCERWRTGCGQCPQFGRWPLHWLRRDGSGEMWRLKRWILRRSQLKVVAVSEWLAGCLRESILGTQSISTILNGVDLASYRPEDRAAARSRLGIPPGHKALLFAVSGNPEDTRKGLDVILAALPSLHDLPLFLLPTGIAGASAAITEALAAYPGLPMRHYPDKASMAEAYRAADLVWQPTKADTFGLVAAEALACGTPVIASAVGGVPEVVCDGANGLLVPPGDPAALATATRRLLTDEALWQHCHRSARASVGSLALDRMVDEYEALYAEMQTGRSDAVPVC